MALLSTYSDANKVTNSLLAVRYTTEFYEDGYYYRLTRTAKKSYAYVGMTRTAAEACRDAKIALYTRNCCREDGENPVTDSDGRTHPGVYQELVCVATVTATRDHDESWRCDITVDESDYLAVKDPPVDCTSPFASYVSAREYDESRPGLTITAISATTIGSADFAQLTVASTLTNPALSIDELRVEKKASSSATSWTTITPYTGSTALTVYATGAISGGEIFRVKARNCVSPAVTYTAPAS